MAKRRMKFSGAHNISDEIADEAQRLGLNAMATGGNCDYIYKGLGKNEDGSDRVVLLGSPDDAGSPDRLMESCLLLIMLNEEWNDQVTIPVSNCRAGMALMTQMSEQQ